MSNKVDHEQEKRVSSSWKYPSKRKFSYSENKFEDNGSFLSFSNSNQFILDANNSSNNENAGNYNNINLEARMRADFDDKMRLIWRGQTD